MSSKSIRLYGHNYLFSSPIMHSSLNYGFIYISQIRFLFTRRYLLCTYLSLPHPNISASDILWLPSQLIGSLLGSESEIMFLRDINEVLNAKSLEIAVHLLLNTREKTSSDLDCRCGI